MSKRREWDIRSGIVAACREMNALGINQGTSGNISARSGDDLLITPSGLSYNAMTPGDIVRMDLDGGYYGELLPSSEWRMHVDIARERPEAGAIVHTHANYCTSLSCIREGIPAFHYMIGVAGGTGIRCAEYATFGTQELSDSALSALEGRTVCLLANHGMLCIGGDLAKAMWLAVEVETLAKQYWLARQAGDPVILSDDEMNTVLARFKTYGKQVDELEDGDAMSEMAPVRRDLPPVRSVPRKRKTDPRRPRSKPAERSPRRKR